MWKSLIEDVLMKGIKKSEDVVIWKKKRRKDEEEGEKIGERIVWNLKRVDCGVSEKEWREGKREKILWIVKGEVWEGKERELLKKDRIGNGWNIDNMDEEEEKKEEIEKRKKGGWKEIKGGWENDRWIKRWRRKNIWI